jgi:hypothetical protein
VLGFLISSEWVLGEAKDLGVNVTDKEVAARLNQLKKQQFPKEAEFQKFLASTGQSVSDLLLRVKLSMVSQKIQEKISKNGKERQRSGSHQVLQRTQVQFGQPERRSIRIILTKTEAETKQAKAKSIGKSLPAWPRAIDRPDPQEHRRGAARRRQRPGGEALDTAIFGQKDVLGGPVTRPSATTSTKWGRSRRPPSRPWCR